MKRKFVNYTGFLLVMAVILVLKDHYQVLAGYLPIATPDKYGNLPSPDSGNGLLQVVNLVKMGYNNVKYIIGTVAILFITYAGLRMIMSHGEESVITEQKNAILYGAIGLGLISMAETISAIFAFGGSTGFLNNPEQIARTSILLNEQAQMIIDYIKILIGSVAVFFIVRASAKLIVAGYDDEVITKEKKNLAYGSIGLIGIILADTIVNGILFKIDPNVNYQAGIDPALDAPAGVREIIGITNFVVTFGGPLAILSFIIGAIYYATSLDNDERMQTAKKIIINSIIGLIIIYGAFAMVSTFTRGYIGSGVEKMIETLN